MGQMFMTPTIENRRHENKKKEKNMMMTFENFKKKLVNEVQEALGDERKVCVTVICKNNQTET